MTYSKKTLFITTIVVRTLDLANKLVSRNLH